MNQNIDSLFTNIVYRLDHPEDKLRQIRKKLYLFSAIVLGLVFLLSIISQYLRASSTFNTFWINSFTHSLFESYCAIVSLTIAYVIYREYRSSGKRSNLLLFLAFASMSVFDFFHAYSNNNITLFVWFHTLSAFSGGAFFLWGAFHVNKNTKDTPRLQRFFVLTGIILSLAVASVLANFFSLLPGAITAESIRHEHVELPYILYFTPQIDAVNMLATICFLFSGVRFFRYFKKTNDVIYHVFALAAFLFFESELLFAFSNIWDPSWWYWHVIKLIIYIGLIIGLAHGFSRTFHELFESRMNLSRTVNELKLAYDHLKNTQEELLEAEKLASIGKMAATISHEIRNPLGAIKNSAGIFKRHTRLAHEDEELLDIIGNEINRLDTIISELLEFAKPHPLRKTHENLNDLIDETIALLVHNEKASSVIQIRRLLDAHLPALFLDRNAMKQVLWNILVNSTQAMPQGGILTIKTLSTKTSCPDNLCNEISIIIADTGLGMSPEIISKAFQPFFSTKSKGTGLGLSIVERIIKQHGGRISVDSTICEGTQVKIDIPFGSGETQVAEEPNHVVYLDCR